jgi:hypothetical protein
MRSLLAIFAILYGAAWAAIPAASQAPGTAESAPAETTGWYCPMHPDVTAPDSGRCSKCGMALIAGNPFDTRDYRLEFSMRPAALKAEVPVTMTFRVAHPGTGMPVKEFEVVHDRRYHLFVISEDMTVFQHIHPDLQPDGSWTIQTMLPKAGYYRLFSDFVPTGGAPQFLGRALVTTDFDGDLASSAVQLEADALLVRTVDTLTATVTLDPPTLIAGQYGHFTYTLTDARTSEPVTDLQPYLGAFGHTLILSEDMADYVHSHPTEGPESDITKGIGGPRVTFEGYLPRPGRYRAWTQFLRNDQVTTVSFTFTVRSLEDAVRLGR